jgi:hypothetical protein
MSVVARTTGKRAVYAALPPHFLIGVVVVVAFAGNGMDARTVTDAALASPTLRLASLLGWVLASLPVARLLLADPSGAWLRSLPVAGGWLPALTGFGLLLSQLAWAALWARGAGALAAASAVLAALGLSCQLLARAQTPSEWLRLPVMLGAWLLAPSPLALLVAAAASALAYRHAWRRAPEPEASGRDRLLRLHPTLAIASALGSAAYRDDRSAVTRWLALVLLAFAGVRLGAEHNVGWSAHDVVGLGAGLWALSAALGAITLARPLLIAERQLAWIFDVCGASLRRRALVSIALVAALAALAGACVGVALALHDARASELPLELSVVGAAWAGLAAALVRITTRGTGRDGGRQLLALIGAYVALRLLPFSHRALELAALVAGAGLATLLAARHRLPAPRELGGV